MRRKLLAGLCFLLLPFLALASGNSVPKFALVIGNQDYAGHNRSLSNTVRDAALMADSLTRLGFVVTRANNRTRSQLVADVASFADKLPAGATAFIYYAGHGMQIGGRNYLIPVDMVPSSEQAVPVRAYSLEAILERLARAATAVNVVVLDACRDNPFQPARSVRHRNFRELGLAPVQAPRGTLLAFSTGPGQLAADGKGSNSIYTAQLAKTLLQPGLELREVFDLVGNQVRKQTLDDQIPWYETSLTGKYFFEPPPGVSVVAGKSPQLDGVAKNTLRSRGKGTAAELTPEIWYSTMSAREWNALDWEIQQRVRRLTADELPRLEHKAKGGSVVAQTVLGLAYREGIRKSTVAQTGQVIRHDANNTKAWHWLSLAAQSGFPVAEVLLGEMYFAGHGVDRDMAKARSWLEKAAVSNYPRAKLNLLQINLVSGESLLNQGEVFKNIFGDYFVVDFK